jgi:hypothetical protein
MFLKTIDANHITNWCWPTKGTQKELSIRSRAGEKTKIVLVKKARQIWNIPSHRTEKPTDASCMARDKCRGK